MKKKENVGERKKENEKARQRMKKQEKGVSKK
jgi:hypothetical protein